MSEITTITTKNFNKLEWLTLQECAAACTYKDVERISKAIKDKELRAFRFERRKLLVLKEDLVKWMLSKQTLGSSSGRGPVKPSLKEQLASAAKQSKN
jgi:hypothetical protein